MPPVPAKPVSAVTKEDFDKLSKRLSHQMQSRLCRALDVIEAKTQDVINAMDRLTQEFAQILPDPLTIERPVIHYRLELDSDAQLVREMKQAGMLAKFQSEGGIWEHVVQVRIPPSPQAASSPGSPGSRTAHRPCLRLEVSSAEAEDDIRKHAADISRILGLSVNCRAIPPEYLVQIVGLFREDGDDGHQYAALVGTATKTDVKRAFWTRNKLVLSLTKDDDARRLCDEGVKIHGRKFRAVGYDRRSAVKLCYKCFGPGHLQDECASADFRCGRCAGEHDVKTCPRGTPAKCCNCGNDHEAWSSKCNDPAVAKQRKISARHAGEGPAWARRPNPSNDTPGAEATTQNRAPDAPRRESPGHGEAYSDYGSSLSDLSALLQQSLSHPPGQTRPTTPPRASRGQQGESLWNLVAPSPPQTPEERKGPGRQVGRPRTGSPGATDESDEEYNPDQRKTRGKGQGGKGGSNNNGKAQQPVQGTRRPGRPRGSKNKKK